MPVGVWFILGGMMVVTAEDDFKIEFVEARRILTNQVTYPTQGSARKPPLALQPDLHFLRQWQRRLQYNVNDHLFIDRHIDAGRSCRRSDLGLVTCSNVQLIGEAGRGRRPYRSRRPLRAG